jgi:hypothetical protein
MSTSDDTSGRISDETVEADERDARSDHRADRPPTPEEEAAAERDPELTDEQATAYEEAIERGAHVRGEGQIEP